MIPANSPTNPAPDAHGKPGRWQGIGLALALGVALLALSYVRLVGDTRSQLFNTNVMNSIFAGSIWGTKLARNLGIFATTLLLLHLAFGFLSWLLARLSELAWPRVRATRVHWTLLWFAGLTITLLAHNIARFPRSSLSQPYAGIMGAQSYDAAIAAALAALASVAVVATLIAAVLRVQRSDARFARTAPTLWTAAVAVTAIVGSAAFIRPPAARAAPAATSSAPNIIIIGFDSLRCDIAPVDHPTPLMPHLSEFLTGAARFTDAMTPLARTFPSWVSLLTGRHPHTTGAVMNLMRRDQIDTRGTLPDLLREHGYHTTYGIDDVRFSNVDASFGFDDVLTPPIGATEFVIGWFGDTPLSNLIVNTRAGAWLFPHLHANRAAATVYDPDTFVQRIGAGLKVRQPQMLAVHLTLPHWPYSWADAPLTPPQPDSPMPEYYTNAARRVDQQFGELMSTLRERGMLENAVVIVLSDHGEAFGVKQESLVPVDSMEVLRAGAVPTWGHGTSVFSAHQYSVVLGLRGYGPAMSRQLPATRISAPVSLEDVTPTVAALLGLRPHAAYDGRSLLPLLSRDPGGATTWAGRVRFTETEFSAPNVAEPNGKVNMFMINRLAGYYVVDPVTDRVEMKTAWLDVLRYSRQFAAIGDTELLAAVPDPSSRNFIYLLVKRRGGFPRRLTAVPGDEMGPEVTQLWSELHRRFGPELATATTVLALSTRRPEPTIQVKE